VFPEIVFKAFVLATAMPDTEAALDEAVLLFEFFRLYIVLFVTIVLP